MYLGHDVSQYQGNINFDVFKNNTNFVIVKATEGNGYMDPRFRRNQSEARRVNLPLGYYHFARPDLGNSPLTEADYFLTTIGQPKQGEIFVLDYECPNQTPAHVDWCKKWLDRVYSKITVRPFIYLNQSQVQKFNWKPVVDANYALWIAAYTFDPNNNEFITGAWPIAAMQQWTDKQQVPGIVGNVDGNVFFGDAVAFKKYGYGPSNPVPPEPDYKTLYIKEKSKVTRMVAIGNE